MKKISVNDLISKRDFSEELGTAKLLQLNERNVYENGEKTDKIVFEATAILPEFDSAIISVKLDSKPTIENISIMPEVIFNHLTAKAWVKDNHIELSFTAESMLER